MAKQLGKDQENGKSTARVEEIAGNLTQETFLESVHEIVEIKREMAALNEKKKAIRKRVKARGVELGDLDEAVKMAEWDRDEVRAKFERRRLYAQWLGLPIGVQSDLFKGMTADDKAAAEWEARGYTARLANGSESPPEDCPDECHKAYKRGWKKAGGEKLKEGKGEKPKGPKRDESTGAILAPEPDPEMEKEFDGAGPTAQPGNIVPT